MSVKGGETGFFPSNILCRITFFHLFCLPITLVKDFRSTTETNETFCLLVILSVKLRVKLSTVSMPCFVNVN